MEKMENIGVQAPAPCLQQTQGLLIALLELSGHAGDWQRRANYIIWLLSEGVGEIAPVKLFRNLESQMCVHLWLQTPRCCCSTQVEH